MQFYGCVKDSYKSILIYIYMCICTVCFILTILLDYIIRCIKVYCISMPYNVIVGKTKKDSQLY